MSSAAAVCLASASARPLAYLSSSLSSARFWFTVVATPDNTPCTAPAHFFRDRGRLLRVAVSPRIMLKSV